MLRLGPRLLHDARDDDSFHYIPDRQFIPESTEGTHDRPQVSVSGPSGTSMPITARKSLAASLRPACRISGSAARDRISASSLLGCLAATARPPPLPW